MTKSLGFRALVPLSQDHLRDSVIREHERGMVCVCLQIVSCNTAADMLGTVTHAVIEPAVMEHLEEPVNSSDTTRFSQLSQSLVVMLLTVRYSRRNVGVQLVLDRHDLSCLRLDLLAKLSGSLIYL